MKNKKTILIFTGHDMAGKTTIAKELSKQINIPYFKSNKQHDRNHDHLLGLQYSIEEFTQLFERTPYSYILDRFVETEYVYSSIMNRETDENLIWEIDQRLANIGVKYIYCFKDESKYIQDDLNMIDKEKYNDLKYMFDRFFSQSKCEVLFLDTSDENLSEQINQIKKFI